ncbi:MAG: undecaprenyl-diphosphate phosphatase [Clostridiales bacterium]|nr:undecaprenyl-diphosphate phosphatase [Clostridiales bacterium]
MDFIEILKAIIYGIVEGITEWLPISSTGHLIILEDLLKFKDMRTDFWNLFLVVIQLGAILAVIVIYFKKLFPVSRSESGVFIIEKSKLRLWLKIIIASIPAAVIGLPFDDILEKYLQNTPTVATMLIVVGIVFIIVENYNKDKKANITRMSELSYKTAFFIGISQVLAMIPGTSRSGITIIAALLLGASRVIAAEFTFYLAIPVMLGASLLRAIKYGLPQGLNEYSIIITSFIVSFIVSIVVIKFLMTYIKKRDFKVFGWYRIALGIVLFLYMFIK